MENLNKIILDLYQKEIELNLYSYKVNNISIWRIVRFKFRLKVLKKSNFTNKTKRLKLNPFNVLKFQLISLFQISKLLVSNKKYKNIIFAFPRLTKINGEYIDKFTDPILGYIDENDENIIFQRHNGGQNYSPRINRNKIIYIDFLILLCTFLSLSFLPFFYVVYKHNISKFTSQLNKLVTLSFKDKFYIYNTLCKLLISDIIFGSIYKQLKNKNLLVVSREIFIQQIIPAKKRKINVIELQHGITRTPTPYYTGFYDEIIDPDYFFVFGEEWKNDYFGIPKDKIINIGWAYTDFAKKNISNLQINTEQILVLSSPEITVMVIDFILEASKYNPNFQFKLRLHPQESLTKIQSEIIKNTDNIQLDDNSVDSIFSVIKHKFILGQNSSVLFEALSLDKVVAVFNLPNLKSVDLKSDIKLGFEIISQPRDLETFILKNENNLTKNNEFYSIFNKNNFQNIIK